MFPQILTNTHGCGDYKTDGVAAERVAGEHANAAVVHVGDGRAAHSGSGVAVDLDLVDEVAGFEQPAWRTDMTAARGPAVLEGEIRCT